MSLNGKVKYAGSVIITKYTAVAYTAVQETEAQRHTFFSLYIGRVHIEREAVGGKVSFSSYLFSHFNSHGLHYDMDKLADSTCARAAVVHSSIITRMEYYRRFPTAVGIFNLLCHFSLWFEIQ